MAAINYVAVDGSMETTIRSDTPLAHIHIYIYIIYILYTYTNIYIGTYLIETDETRMYIIYTFKLVNVEGVCVCVVGV